MQPDSAWTTGARWSSPDQGLHQTIARLASARPERPALVCEGRTVSYRELDQLADAWAADLADAGLMPGSLVPIVLPRGVDLIVALLAVLKAGCGYALLDPAWPAPRRADVTGQLGSPVVITEPLRARPDAPAGFRPVPVRGADPCCVFFTSGTTGRPKGVISPHRAIARLFQRGTFAEFTQDTVMPLAAPMPWDAFSLELFGALLNGGTSVLIDEPYLSAGALRRSIARSGVNTVWLTSSLFNMIVDEDPAAFGGLRQVMIGGERLSTAHVRRFLRQHAQITLLNGYGPVETTVFATTHEITLADCDRRGGIPLGRPVPGTGIVVLDAARPCAVGEEGEICVCGEGLAVRYLGDAELTAAKFPVLDVDGAPLMVYRTGDLGCWAPDGLLEYRGRVDRQVKIRGHRVEPAEVEHAVEELPAVRQCRVIARRDESGAVTSLLAFCVPADPGDALDGATAALRATLPAYQVPSAVISVGSFPLTAQGKLDERALLAAAAAQPAAEEADHADHADRADHADTSDDPLARLVAGAFAAVLGRARVPSDVSFFALGGGSLAAGAVCARIGARLSRPVPVTGLYQHPTVTAFARWLRSAKTQTTTVPDQAADEDAPLTPMQLAFLTRHLARPSERTGYCLMFWQVDGDIDTAALESAVGHVHDRHEALRAAYVPDPKPSARLTGIDPPALEIMPAQVSADAAVSALRAAFAETLEVTEADVWRAGLVPVAGTATSVFGCVVHHIAFDGWSEAVLARDLSAAYARPPGRPEPHPLSLSAAARQYAAHQAHADIPAQAQAIRRDLAGTPPLRWPGPSAGQSDAEPGHVTTTISADLLAGLDAMAARAGVTRFVVLLAEWANAVATVTGQRDFAVGVPAAQRYTPLHEDAIGCFLSTVCVRLKDAALDGGPAGIRAAGQSAARAFAAQDVPYTAVVDALEPRNNGRPPVFQVLFALQDITPPRLELAGTRTTLLRQPYLDLPLELHTEIWPEQAGGLRVTSSYRHDAVDAGTAGRIAGLFMRNLAVTAEGERCSPTRSLTD